MDHNRCWLGPYGLASWLGPLWLGNDEHLWLGHLWLGRVWLWHSGCLGLRLCAEIPLSKPKPFWRQPVQREAKACRTTNFVQVPPLRCLLVFCLSMAACRPIAVLTASSARRAWRGEGAHLYAVLNPTSRVSCRPTPAYRRRSAASRVSRRSKLARRRRCAAS